MVYLNLYDDAVGESSRKLFSYWNAFRKKKNFRIKIIELVK